MIALLQQSFRPHLNLSLNQMQSLIRQIIAAVLFEAEIQQMAQLLMVPLLHELFSRTDEIVVDTGHQGLNIPTLISRKTVLSNVGIP